MVDLIRKMTANNIELTISNLPTQNDILKVLLCSRNCCMVKYFNLYDCADTVFGNEVFVKWLNIFYEEFINEKNRREHLARILVSTCEQEQKDFILERRQG